MAKDTRRVPICVVCAKRSRGGRLCGFNAARDEAYGKTSDERALEKQNAPLEQVTPCLSFFTFREPCGNLPPDAVGSRSKTQLQRWPTPCPHSGQSIQESEIVSQLSKDRCGNTSTFLSAKKTLDIWVDLRLLSQPEVRSRSYQPSAVDARTVRCPAVMWASGFDL